MTLETQIESLLFWKNESVTRAWLAKSLEKTSEEIAEALHALEASLQGRGVVLQQNGEEVALKTSPEASSLIEKFSKEELVKELTPSALETLSIIVYQGPLAKKEIDYIRGVNSGFILRNLLIRGLIEKVEQREGATGRGNSYKPTLDLLSLLGITKIEELEEYEQVKKELENFKQQDVENQSN
jgi:segregation and condensation protein B